MSEAWAMNSLPFHVWTRDIVSKPKATQQSIRPEATDSQADWKHNPPVAPPPSILLFGFGQSPR